MTSRPSSRPSRALAWNRVRYTLYAPIYDLLIAHLPVFPRGRRRSIALARLQPGERVLIVAAGTGLDLEFLPPDVLVIAGDITPAMVRRLEARAARLGRTVEARVMDAQALDLPDGSVDCVLMHLAVAVVPDPERAMAEAARVVRPGGRVAIFDKFQSDAGAPSLLRRAANVVARLVVTDINRRLGPLVAGAGLRLAAREPVGVGGFFVAARADKPAS